MRGRRSLPALALVLILPLQAASAPVGEAASPAPDLVEAVGDLTFDTVGSGVVMLTVPMFTHFTATFDVALAEDEVAGLVLSGPFTWVAYRANVPRLATLSPAPSTTDGPLVPGEYRVYLLAPEGKAMSVHLKLEDYAGATRVEASPHAGAAFRLTVPGYDFLAKPATQATTLLPAAVEVGQLHAHRQSVLVLVQQTEMIGFGGGAFSQHFRVHRQGDASCAVGAGGAAGLPAGGFSGWSAVAFVKPEGLWGLQTSYAQTGTMATLHHVSFAFTAELLPGDPLEHHVGAFRQIGTYLATTSGEERLEELPWETAESVACGPF